MKKVISIFTLAFAMLFVLNTAQAEQLTVTAKIVRASYSEADHCFYVYTKAEKNGSFWVIDIHPKQNETLKHFKARTIGHWITFTYDEEEQEIIKATIK